eukprot:TRINITY_DN2640_c0_g1_i1.p1 TRINITY_DN2640_c0_g1~~TRINITY_DN2640_c0_g1_i1.p1  ORF type:complete len:804 (-),score=182.09 TRINITY_DN2640_c0_g1_i1:375-2786(-)
MEAVTDRRRPSLRDLRSANAEVVQKAGSETEGSSAKAAGPKLKLRKFNDFVTCPSVRELPYCLWNTCPLLICGLLPVFIMVMSAIFRFDYAREVAEAASQVTDDIGLSYTIYYTAGCWQRMGASEDGSTGPAAAALRGLLGKGHKGSEETRGSSLHGEDGRGLGCSTDDFEVAVGEFSALSGVPLRVRNVTGVHAHRIDALKPSPDWRYVVFSAVVPPIPKRKHIAVPKHTVPTTSLRPKLEHAADLEERRLGLEKKESLRPNLWVVEADKTNAARAAPVFTDVQLNALEDGCQRLRPQLEKVSVSALLHLQVIAQERFDVNGTLVSDDYRAAFAFECASHGTDGERQALASGLATVDFQIHLRNATKIREEEKEGEVEPLRYQVLSQLRILDLSDLEAQRHMSAKESFREAQDAKNLTSFTSFSCPRFVPSEFGNDLLFVASSGDSFEKDAARRRLAVVKLPHRKPSERLPDNREEAADALWALENLWGQLKAVESNAFERTVTSIVAPANGSNVTVAAAKGGKDEQAQKETKKMLFPAVLLAKAKGRLLELGEGGLPVATVKGCPEFLPGSSRPARATRSKASKSPPKEDLKPLVASRSNASLLISGQDGVFAGVAANVSSTGKHSHKEHRTEQVQVLEKPVRDTFIFESDPSSASVIGIAAQMVSVSLSGHKVSDIQLRFNLADAPHPFSQVRARIPARKPDKLRHHVVSGCRPVHATSWLLSEIDRERPTAPLVCLTSDQRLALLDRKAVEDENLEQNRWLNFSMPYPVWSGRPTQPIWCPEERSDGCFEVWSTPNPNW